MTTTLQDRLSKPDLVELISLSYRSLACQNHDDLRRLILDLHNVFEFNNTLYARANILNLFSDNTEQQPVEIYNISYPKDFIQNYIDNRHYLADASIREMINSSTPVDCYSATGRCSKEYVSFVRKNHFTSENTWMHGTLDPSALKYVGFSFVGPATENSERILDILEYIVPFYSEAFNRIATKGERASFNLTPKELEILRWIKEGKSSWDISVMLRCSKRTVDFHVENAKAKLNAVSRAQAVAIALHHGLIVF